MIGKSSQIVFSIQGVQPNVHLLMITAVKEFQSSGIYVRENDQFEFTTVSLKAHDYATGCNFGFYVCEFIKDSLFLTVQ